ncbi:MAG: hypothetical protein EA390_00400 [Balneolaceae bacterium]|nr:MAG: hypothetical protein EA390_00400 [Balneolaceae bacterium]
MNSSIYTLLIVESPVIARIIQQKAPPSIYVVATEGFCWRPEFDSKTGTLKAIADPAKREIRKELREQAKWAGDIIVATDRDPSGDFIAWSVSRFLKTSFLKRAQIHQLTKSGIVQSVSEPLTFDHSTLETELRNQYLIRNLWDKTASLPAMLHAGLASFFSSSVHFTRFIDENNLEYRSSRPVLLPGDEWLPVRPDTGLLEYRQDKPLSTYDVLDALVRESIADHFTEAQLLLQQLFQTTLHHSQEALISYPRTDVNAFYSETWDTLRTQYLSFGSQNQLKPIFLQEVADSDAPHESIHPLNLNLTPDSVTGELPKKIGSLYSLIYNRTAGAITLPNQLERPLVNDLNPDLFFYTTDADQKPEAESLRPSYTVTDLGQHLKKLNLLSPSGFGKQMDKWIQGNLLVMDQSGIKPGKSLYPLLEKSNHFFELLSRLAALRHHNNLSTETVHREITS